MKMDVKKIKEWLDARVLSRIKPDKPLTEAEKRRRGKFIVYPALGILFLGCIWLVFQPSPDKKDGQGNGFNTEIPSPEKRDMEASKVDAYERQEMAEKEKRAYERQEMAEKEKRRKDTFEEMASLFDKREQEEQGKEPVRLPDTVKGAPRTDAGRSSVEAYRNMNRTLGNVYTSGHDPEKEALRRRVEWSGNGKRKPHLKPIRWRRTWR